MLNIRFTDWQGLVFCTALDHVKFPSDGSSALAKAPFIIIDSAKQEQVYLTDIQYDRLARACEKARNMSHVTGGTFDVDMWTGDSPPCEVKQGSGIPAPTVDEVHLFGAVDRTLSEMKHLIDHPEEFDSATFQTLKHHLEDMDLFLKYAAKKLTKLGVIKSLPPVAAQQERGY